MKTATYLILTTALLLAAPSARAQETTLGDVTFDAASADADVTWYDPMRFDTPTILEGFGAITGRTRTVTYSSGGLVAGVKTIKRQTVETGIAPTTETLWIAFDAANDSRVLKIERAGAVVFEATAELSPPMYLPSLPTDGQSWDLGGTAVTVTSVIASNSGTCLKVTYGAGDQAESRFLRVGDGIIYIEAGNDSGWRPRPAQPTP